MKKLILSLLFVLAVSVKAQIMSLKVDTVQMFQFDSKYSFEQAYDSGYVELTVSRIYNEQGKVWSINRTKRTINFGGPDYNIIRTEEPNFKVVYLDDTNEFKLFLMTEKYTGKELVFFLEPEKNGKISGGFGYPKIAMK